MDTFIWSPKTALFGDKISYVLNHYDAIENADALVINTEWSVFRTPDFSLVSEKLNNKLIFDGRNLYDTSSMKELGYTYYSIGRENIISK